ncbi:hypothetical protein CEPID_05160 [Corynebacterium epidermidicanis]|uniref:Uncharacterized protein n=1 Tax=Corynebacterium epidermidicanis TaxID=1050174 RepID=A0A0G3GNU6_9CORY|nr:hypothetical protein CEPID_05160 [Corynebacterium epidermidicanis]
MKVNGEVGKRNSCDLLLTTKNLEKLTLLEDNRELVASFRLASETVGLFRRRGAGLEDTGAVYMLVPNLRSETYTFTPTDECYVSLAFCDRKDAELYSAQRGERPNCDLRVLNLWDGWINPNYPQLRDLMG